MRLRDVAEEFGKGIFAGVAGTAAMALSSTIEMEVRGRPASSTRHKPPPRCSASNL
jgi:hypothetical protein